MVRKLSGMDQIMKTSYWFHGTHHGRECSALVVDLPLFVNAPEHAEISVALLDEQGEEEWTFVCKGEVTWHTIEAC